MTHASRTRSLSFALVASALAACSGSSSSDGAFVSLAVTDAASDELSTFTIGLESVELQSATGAPVSLLQLPTAVDFAALTDLSRVLNLTSIPADTYTGVEVTFLFDNDRVVINGSPAPAALLDSDGNALTGTLTMPVEFAVPIDVTNGHYVIELDLDLNQSTEVDVGNNEVTLEPSILPRVNRNDPKEHAIGGDLRTVVLAQDLFRIGLDADVGDPTPVVEVHVGPGTVFQIDGVSQVGAAGLSTLDTLPVGSWVQAFGSVGSSSRRFQATTVEAGTGSYNGGSDIVEGVVIGRTGGAGADAALQVRGHSNDSTHTFLEFNLTFTVNTTFANTKVVRRGSATVYDTDDVNVGQHVRVFGVLNTFTNTLDATTSTDVVRMEPTWVYGTANEVPGTANAGQLEIDLLRVDLRDVGVFDWPDSGTNPPTPTAFTLGDPSNLSTGKLISAGKPIVAQGFFAPVDAAGADFVASRLDNREQLPSVLLIRDRTNGLTVTTTPTSSSIDYTFAGAPVTFEKAVIDQGFVGQTDVVPTGISIEPSLPLGLGVYMIRDRTLNTVTLYATFNAFYQAVDAKLLGGAQLYNVGALGVYDSGSDSIASALAAVTVQ